MKKCVYFLLSIFLASTSFASKVYQSSEIEFLDDVQVKGSFAVGNTPEEGSIYFGNDGNFNINPADGIDGLYICNTNFSEYLENVTIDSGLIVKKDIKILTQDDPSLIDLDNGCDQLFIKTDWSYGVYPLVIPDLDVDKLGTLNLYLTEIPSYEFWYTIDNHNIIGYPLEPQWLTDTEDAIWKIELSHISGSDAWQYVGCVKYNLTDTHFIVNDSGIILHVYPQPTGNIIIPSQVNDIEISSIGANVFEGNENLISVDFPETIQYINDSAFKDCINLTTILFTTNITAVANDVFSNCNINRIKYFRRSDESESSEAEERIKTILSDSGIDVTDPNIVFEDLTLMDNITWSYEVDNSTPISLGTFGSSNVKIKISGSSPALSGRVKIPEEIDGCEVVSIAEEAFKNNSTIVYIEFPSTLRDIGKNAFNSCTNLETVIFPDGDLNLDWGAFYNCTKLKNVIFSTNQHNIVFGDQLFNNCTSLENIRIPEGVTQIAARDFYHCTALTNVIFSDTLYNVYWEAFNGCSNLRSITVGTNYHSVYTTSSTPFGGCKISNVVLRSAYIPLTTMFYGTDIGSIKNVIMDDSITVMPNNMFSNCGGITNIILPKKLTHIGSYAFYRCTNLISISKIPVTVTNIGYWSFMMCSSLTSDIDLSKNKLYRLDQEAFVGCSSISNILLPVNYNAIEQGSYYRLFDGCVNLVNSKIPVSIHTLADNMYQDCRSLKNLVIPLNVTNLDNAYNYCSGLTNITILPNFLKDWTNAPFKGCSSIETIQFGDQVERIGNHLFNSIGIRNLDLTGNSLSYIGSNSFANCANLTNINIGSNISYMANNAFDSCPNIISYNVDENNQNYSSNDGILLNQDGSVLIRYPTGNTNVDYTIPETISTLNDYSFAYSQNLTNIVIPNSVTNIKQYAFYGSNLQSVELPDSITEINDYSFASNSSLKNIVIPSTVTNIGKSAFYQCGLSSISIPSSVINIDDDAFYYNSSLNSITFSDGLQNIGDHAFSWSGLTSISLPNTLTNMGSSAFSHCSLVSAELGTGLTSISDNAFYNSINLKTVTIPNNILDIELSAFANCYALTNVVFPTNLLNIGDQAFISCHALKYVDLSNTAITNIGRSAFVPSKNYTELTNIFIPTTLKTISRNSFNCDLTIKNLDAWAEVNYPQNESGGSVFAGYKKLYLNNSDNELQNLNFTTASYVGQWRFRCCASITNIVIGNTVKDIGSYTFSQIPNLTSVSIGDGVTNIDSYAFADCSNLVSVVLGTNIQSIGDYAFNSCTSITNIIIPESIINLGQQAFKSCTCVQKISIMGQYTNVYEFVIDHSGSGRPSYYNSPFQNISSLQTVELGGNLETLWKYTFCNCGPITNIIVGINFQSIDTSGDINKHQTAFKNSLADNPNIFYYRKDDETNEEAETRITQIFECLTSVVGGTFTCLNPIE